MILQGNLSSITIIYKGDHSTVEILKIILPSDRAAFLTLISLDQGRGPWVVVSTAAFLARVRGAVSGIGRLKETKTFLPHPRVKLSIVGSLRDREVACSVSDRQGSNFESCVWRTVSSHSSHHPQEALLAHFSLYVHKGGLKHDSFHFIFFRSEFSPLCFIFKSTGCLPGINVSIIHSFYRTSTRGALPVNIH